MRADDATPRAGEEATYVKLNKRISLLAYLVQFHLEGIDGCCRFFGFRLILGNPALEIFPCFLELVFRPDAYRSPCLEAEPLKYLAKRLWKLLWFDLRSATSPLLEVLLNRGERPRPFFRCSERETRGDEGSNSWTRGGNGLTDYIA